MREKVFINHTNHPSSNWDEDQLKAAREYGEIMDDPFPNVDPDLDTAKVMELVDKNFKELSGMNPSCVLCQGESVYVYHMVQKLKTAGINAIAACSERNVKESVDESGNNVKTIIFSFARFRDY